MLLFFSCLNFWSYAMSINKYWPCFIDRPINWSDSSCCFLVGWCFNAMSASSLSSFIYKTVRSTLWLVLTVIICDAIWENPPHGEIWHITGFAIRLKLCSSPFHICLYVFYCLSVTKVMVIWSRLIAMIFRNGILRKTGLINGHVLLAGRLILHILVIIID